MSGSLTAYLTIIFLALVPISLRLVRYYAEPNFPIHSYITLFIGYYSAFAILLLVPIDIAVIQNDRQSTENASEQNSNYNDNLDTLATAYNVFFTVVLIFANVVLVYQEYYVTDGYFTEKDKIISSFKRMCWDIVIPLIAGLIILGIVIGQGVVGSSVTALKLAAVIVTNTVYETLLMFLLGFALIEFPRSFWNESNLDNYLTVLQTKAAAQFANINETQLSVSLCASDVLKVQTYNFCFAHNLS